VRGAIKPVSGRAADLDRTNPGGGNLVGLILPTRKANSKHCREVSSLERVTAQPLLSAPMRLVEITRAPDPGRRHDLAAFVERLATEAGSRPLSDHLWLDLNEGGRPGFVAVSAADPTGIIALAQISHANEGSLLEVVVDPSVPDSSAVHDDVLETAVDAFRSAGGGHLTWWTDADDEGVRRAAHQVGLVLERSLYEMRVGLPLGSRSSVVTRGFTPADADAWLRVNNRAFAGHPEQGGWDRDTLATRLAEPWFDPDGFRLYEHDGTLAAFCWTKVHDEMTPPAGEIYVIGVDPDLHGRGLGRELTLAGLDWLAEHGLTEAMLFVDGGNLAALRLYERLGFMTRRTRYAFAGTLSA
jgi:mycothiol synthase